MNQRLRLLINILGLSVVLFIGHKLALRANLYWTTAWADVIMHSIGGALLGTVFTYLLSFKYKLESISLKQIIGFAFIVGIIWELFELYTGQTFYYDKGYIIDTLGDIFFDIFGAYLAHLFLIDTQDE